MLSSRSPRIISTFILLHCIQQRVAATASFPRCMSEAHPKSRRAKEEKHPTHAIQASSIGNLVVTYGTVVALFEEGPMDCGEKAWSGRKLGLRSGAVRCGPSHVSRLCFTPRPSPRQGCASPCLSDTDTTLACYKLGISGIAITRPVRRVTYRAIIHHVSRPGLRCSQPRACPELPFPANRVSTRTSGQASALQYLVQPSVYPDVPVSWSRVTSGYNPLARDILVASTEPGGYGSIRDGYHLIALPTEATPPPLHGVLSESRIVSPPFIINTTMPYCVYPTESIRVKSRARARSILLPMQTTRNRQKVDTMYC